MQIQQKLILGSPVFKRLLIIFVKLKRWNKASYAVCLTLVEKLKLTAHFSSYIWTKPKLRLNNLTCVFWKGELYGLIMIHHKLFPKNTLSVITQRLLWSKCSRSSHLERFQKLVNFRFWPATLKVTSGEDQFSWCTF